MTTWTIRDVEPVDIDAVRTVNEMNEPEVGPLDDVRAALFLAAAASFRLVEIEGAVVGVFVGLHESIDYASPNYRWFAARHDRFAYVDRIALQPQGRGLGIAAAIYDDFEAWARSSDRSVLCAEVNTVPPNPRSLRFHERRGFVMVDEVAPYGGDERVAMVQKVL